MKREHSCCRGLRQRIASPFDNHRKPKWLAMTRWWAHFVTLSYDLDLGFQGQILKKTHPGMGVLIDMERKGCGSIGSWAQFVTLDFYLIHDLDLGFSRSNFEKAVSEEWECRLTLNERVWVDLMLNTLCDLELSHWLGFSRSNFEK